jgi:hypothetical protein
MAHIHIRGSFILPLALLHLIIRNCIYIHLLSRSRSVLIGNESYFVSKIYCVYVVGERLIQYASENLVTEVLIHPQTNTFIQCMRNLLSSFTRHRHIIHAGYTFTGNGSWILQVIVNYCVFV